MGIKFPYFINIEFCVSFSFFISTNMSKHCNTNKLPIDFIDKTHLAIQGPDGHRVRY